jgi:Holliday junction resolvase
MSEAKLQREIIEYLKGKGAYVLKNDANYRTGVPDLHFDHSELSGHIEVKDTEKSPYRPLQKLTIQKLQDMGVFCEVIHNNNWVQWRENFEKWL